MRFISWNIDSLNAALTAESARAILSREVLNTIINYEPDVIALQETKLASTGPTKKHLKILEEMFPAYEIVWSCSVEPARKGYAGTMFLYKEDLQPSVSFPTIGAPSTMDAEGRIITLEFENFYLTQVYTPNAGDGLSRLEERQEWDIKYADYLEKLDKEKYVIATGDFNVAHKEIDLAHPKNNMQSAGFTKEERQGFTNLLDRGFTDTFRYIHGDVEGIYTWWAQRAKTSKINNSGWRIDYWLVSDRIADKVIKSEVVNSGPRQDHAPILLEIDL
ncbi:exodeoxyribonuclease III [Miniphocaeibacter halophilus]|uniref:Exodeoxyribonuclease III n=1 Tax=Miniphocaeibacter halophilus TaxID=2931922 RepID=A0AC61MRW2_9FIRM|nr:exodeoxyribonuclease III [Miniphocaeibacter halophilus]QQK08420.1 exodeoxyribonuclease III [Miniphocaeibacter halophilus]